MKKVLACILSVIITLGCVLPCVAANETCTCGQAPIIYVAALGSGSIYLDKGTESEKKLFRPETSDILGEFTPLISAATQLISTKDYDAFGDVLIPCVNNAFGMLAMDDEGNSQENVTSQEFHPENAEHGDNYSYYFGYDFRVDPMENAKLLHQYIQEVKEITGHDTVRFRASSMGGVTTLAYLSLYGSKDIENIIFQNCPLQGTAVAGELYNGLVEIDKDAVLRYAECALPSMDSDFFGAFLYMLLEMLDGAGVLTDLAGMADRLVLNLKDRVFDEALIPIFATMPGIWSFVPHEYYESAKDFMGVNDGAHSVLLEKLDFYHYSVQQSAEELLTQAKADGTNIYIIAGYNMQRTPLVSAYKNTSDGTVDTKYASLGATCAPIGEQLPEDYVQAEHKGTWYISPDRMIDASTCILPENTWFIKDMLHSTTHAGHKEFYKILHQSEEQITVFDMEEYPQFMQNDTVNETFLEVLPLRGSDLFNTAAQAIQMPSFLSFTKLFIAFFEEFFKWMVG
ncbi:MAG: hypothetical protein ACI4VW_02690 [Acutalibacteraceae bacterium]